MSAAISITSFACGRLKMHMSQSQCRNLAIPDCTRILHFSLVHRPARPPCSQLSNTFSMDHCVHPSLTGMEDWVFSVKLLTPLVSCSVLLRSVGHITMRGTQRLFVTRWQMQRRAYHVRAMHVARLCLCPSALMWYGPFQSRASSVQKENRRIPRSTNWLWALSFPPGCTYVAC